MLQKAPSKFIFGVLAMLLPIVACACFANDANDTPTLTETSGMDPASIARPSALHLYSMAKKYEREDKVSEALQYYSSALQTLREWPSGYEYRFGKAIAEDYIALLKKSNNLKAVDAVVDEFCSNKCSNPWSIERERWNRYSFVLPNGLGTAVLDVRLMHPIMAEYEYRLTGKYQNQNFLAKPSLQTGGPPDLAIFLLEKRNGSPSIEFQHTDKDFQGPKFEVLDLQTNKLEDLRNLQKSEKRFIRRTPIGTLDKVLKFRLNDGTEIRSNSIPGSPE